MPTETLTTQRSNTRAGSTLNSTKKAPSAIEAHSHVTVKEAIEQGIEHSRSKSDHHRANLRQWGGYFAKWLSRSHPEIVRWDQVRYQHLDAYVQRELKSSRKISPKSAQHYCSVISIVSSYYARRVNPALYVAIPCVHPYFREDDNKDKVIKYLTTEQIVALLDFAQERRSKTTTGILTVALGCFVGLNQREIVRLTVGDVEQRKGSVVVQVRRSKNQNRARSLPVVSLVAPLLLNEIKGRSPHELLLRTGKGRIAGAAPNNKTTYNNLVDHLLPAAAKHLKCDAYTKVVPSDIVRTSFVNMAIRAEVRPSMRDAYVGHGKQSVLKEYYEDMDLVVDELQREVTDKIDVFLNDLTKTR